MTPHRPESDEASGQGVIRPSDRLLLFEVASQEALERVAVGFVHRYRREHRLDEVLAPGDVDTLDREGLGEPSELHVDEAERTTDRHLGEVRALESRRHDVHLLAHAVDQSGLSRPPMYRR